MDKNSIFVANKPTNISCNHFLGDIKRRYKVKKAGFSGTLDPFANGVLIIAFGQYTKLFRYLNKSPKSYIASLWLGAKSETLDIERVESIEEIEPFSSQKIDEVAKRLTTLLEYLPPKFSAKKVGGKRAYDLARSGQDFELKAIKTQVYALDILEYKHPFITFKVTIDEGGYVRSIGEMFAKELGTFGALKTLERTKEGIFTYEDEKLLNPIQHLKIKQNFYNKDKSDILLGRKIEAKDFQIQDFGEYFLINDNFLSVIKIDEKGVKYELNKIQLD